MQASQFDSTCHLHQSCLNRHDFFTAELLGVLPPHRYTRKSILRMRFAQSGGRCWYCDRECLPTLDHVVPKSKGGGDNPGNLVAACFKCNNSKGDRDIERWYRTREFFSEERLEKIVALNQLRN